MPFFDDKVKKALDAVDLTEFLFGDNVETIINKVKSIEKVGKSISSIKNRRSTQGGKGICQNNGLNWMI